MKNLFLLFLSLMLLLGSTCALAEPAPEAVQLPDGIHSLLQGDKWQTYTPASFIQPGGDEAFLVMSDGQDQRLLHFRHVKDSWQLMWSRRNALPLTDAAVTLTDLSGTELCGMALQSAFSIREARAGAYEYVYELEKGVWRLRMILYRDTDNTILDTYTITPGKVTYEGWRTEGREIRIYGTVQTDLRYFSCQDFPLDPDELKQSLSNPPAIPEGELEAQRIQFTGGKKYPVYNGPGESYGQSGGGKAFVSTNDWIQVFGQENGWILIQYDISRDHMRMGWISAEALPGSARVDELDFRPVTAWLTAAATLTDDPLTSQSGVLTLPEGAWVEWLATMGNWAYVESSTGDLVRGFVPVSRLTRDQVFHLEDHAAGTAHPLRGTLTISAGGTLTLQAEWVGAGAPAALTVTDALTGQVVFTAARQANGSYTGQGRADTTTWQIAPANASGLIDAASAITISK